MKILSVDQMNRIDERTSEQFGISSLILMENAGFQLFRALERDFPEDLREQSIAVFCGKGNNGGDGFVLARLLDQHGYRVEVFLLGTTGEVSGDAQINLSALLKSSRQVVELDQDRWLDIVPGLGRFTVAVDAMLGTGLSKPLGGLYALVVEELNRIDLFRLAVDIPTGLGADSMEEPGLCFRADLTVTFTAPKVAHLLNPAREHLGKIQVVPIGTPEVLLDSNEWNVSVISPDMARAGLPERRTDTHKGSYGHVAVVAGSRDKPGAASLTSWAALRAGSGLVTCFTARSAQPIVAASHAEIMTEPIAETPQGSISGGEIFSHSELLAGKAAVAIGPGLGRAPETVSLVMILLSSLEVPIVLDADGINALEGNTERLRRSVGRPLVLTPHPREFSRISGIPTADVRKNRLEIACRFSRKFQLWLILKDYRTLVATPDGKVLVCPAGNPGMATAGSGDVLTGIVASLTGAAWTAGRRSVEDLTNSVAAAVYLHASAGDLAAASDSMPSLTSTSILDHLGQAFSGLETAPQ